MNIRNSPNPHKGTKNFRFRLEFVNKSIQEHIDYLDYLNSLGISQDQISAGLITHPELLASINLSNFESKTGLKIQNISKSAKSRRGYGYRLYIGSSIIAEIVLGSMDYLRNLMANSIWNKNLRTLTEGFFAKLLNGDGTLTIVDKKRKIPQMRVRIVDQKLSYLRDYGKIMEKFGFNPKINEKYIFVRSYTNLKDLLFLKRIRAFKDNPNEEKLNKMIGIKSRRAKELKNKSKAKRTYRKPSLVSSKCN